MNDIIDKLKQELNYDPETGLFTWARIGIGRPRSKKAGSRKPDGYIVIRVMGYQISGHRLAWAFTYGSFPEKYLDHINGNPEDNRIENLRLASPSQNISNSRLRQDNPTGVKGVRRKPNGRWHARIKHNYREIHIGVYDTLEDARDAIQKARESLHGEFANHG